MRHEAFERRWSRGDRDDDLFRCRARSQPSHAAVHFQMIRTLCERDVRKRMHDWGKVEFLNRGSFGRQKIGHDQDSRTYAGLTQSDSFFHIRNREPLGSFGL
jgi:hypothetical protein